MRIEVTVPNLPESVTDATLLDWHKQPGDTVQKSETLVDLETEKVILEVPVPDNGVLQEIRHVKGDVVGSGELLAVIETEARPAVAEASVPEAMPAKPEPAAMPEAARRPVRFAQPMGPSVRRLLIEHNLDPAQIRGTGREGRLTKQDVLDFLDSQKRKSAEALAPERKPQPEPSEKPAVRGAEGRGERRVPMTRLRARIAERMIEAQHTTATLTTFNEVNMQKIFDLRNQHRARFEQEYKIKLGFMSFFVKAAVEGLRRFPIINASIDGNEIVHHDYYDIGIAVSTDRGLVVPILRDADRLDFAEIEKAIIDFSQKARDGKLSFEDLSGGTFTITNGGIFGSMLSTPILNPPQSAILGMHVIKDRPVVEAGQIVIRPMIYLALSYDHRIIDGREAVTFLFTLKELLEDPVRLLLKI
ncbi:2-oxoglutarate dehydrogenase E2 [Methylocaldum marinum]|uniref:Dihydrolipoyllysine-residue succinyltransferase component of 2-oxoglutarate dehydrogenase complex n=1 Tax=Methylocaldum marinum TaxID=1432792 RepID=A0A250KSE9_9GAMM|nr:2-oxoglutarate dehydrogenase complex dihydrolipoyllysine-residue succinyltransferase [Methylocaldum marinum]BBA34568.1 2-oxoglutarate dehydrogenase E2 [Methylocaldum marinum]